jgi:hypothetical protein
MRWLAGVLAVAVVSQAAGQEQQSARLIFASGICFLYDTTFTTPDGTPTLAGAYEKPLPCPAVIINPHIARRMPESVVLWAILHEIVHIVKRHSVHAPLEVRQMQEAEADCGGAIALRKYWPEMAVEVAVLVKNYLKSGEEHGTPEDRAARVAACAKPEP